MSSAIVVGSGPNGLACAATLASRGVEVTVIEAAAVIGGGTRSSELTVPGLLHDECSAFHPMAVSSPAVASLGLELERHGLVQFSQIRRRVLECPILLQLRRQVFSDCFSFEVVLGDLFRCAR